MNDFFFLDEEEIRKRYGDSEKTKRTNWTKIRGEKERKGFRENLNDMEKEGVLKELDLTGNLLSDWREIAAICKELPALVTLNLSYNIMSHDISGMPLLNHIKVVVLNHTGICWKLVEMLKDSLPLVEELHLMGNKLRGITPLSSDIVHGFDSLRLLNLENSFIAAWDEILKLSQLKRLEQLFLNNNCINHIWYPDHNSLSEPPNSDELLGESLRPFQNLRCLLVGGNKIEDFSSIDALNLFPNLLANQRPVSMEMKVKLDFTALTLVCATLGLKFFRGSEDDGEESAGDGNGVKGELTADLLFFQPQGRS
ncbi:hypothetical protein HAX54_029638 [Datura stramonium]|uniref:Uncharacterized protein n=1 Tax=Datura stramonium TaxID=4076 RepID=A0ABS8SAB9_DATST|nr:hypothetical protein [Datura stramonium]